jgi:hypothetical protein
MSVAHGGSVGCGTAVQAVKSGLYSHCGHWDFSLTSSGRSMALGVDPVSNSNEYLLYGAESVLRS